MTIGIADRVRPDIVAGDGLPDDLPSHFIMLGEQRLVAREQGSVVAKAVDGVSDAIAVGAG